MSDRAFHLTGPTEAAAAQLWAHIQEKTMLDGETLPKFDSPVDAAESYLPLLSRHELHAMNLDLVRALQKMRLEREDIFEKNSALEDATGKLMKEKAYLQQQLAGAINSFTDQQTRWMARMAELTSQKSPSTAAAQTDPERPQSRDTTLEASPQ